MNAPDRPCANCGERPATTRWVGNAGSLAVSHGMYAWWCDVCVLRAQIDHAVERAAALPGLVARLSEALGYPVPVDPPVKAEGPLP